MTATEAHAKAMQRYLAALREGRWDSARDWARTAARRSNGSANSRLRQALLREVNECERRVTRARYAGR